MIILQNIPVTAFFSVAQKATSYPPMAAAIPSTFLPPQKPHHFPTASKLSSRRRSSGNEEGIPIEDVKTLVKFKSRHNYIRVLEVARRADHSLAGCRLLLLDTPGNIHSISHLFKPLTDTYFDVFATLPPIIPPGPVGILGFGAGSAAKLLLEMYPKLTLHGWELDPEVISVGRRFFGLEKLENDYRDRLFIHTGDALEAGLGDGFSGILVDLFSKGCLIPELQDERTWEKMKGRLKKGGRMMVNVGGSCVEAEDKRKDGKMVMQQTLEVIHRVFPGQVFAMSLGFRKDDSTIAFTGDAPDFKQWKNAVPKPLRFYVDMWRPYAKVIL